ncbi:hypothetical protein [Polyangium jinanense]|uniref:Uncharacterized protein n=1 Tax=Polyangium jinanense TaxID=2829994 RepID=A0A9X3X3J4_9BACT|nr:hypothetical protein [Polyangium jinanense]MDC3955327.1 hypothetical protein [Polyangium jinanense]MDC3981628.1 hypothetical protein [Polyangium jinanense]
MVDEQASGPDPDLPEIPRDKPRRSPYRRLVLLALFALTLPFEWGQRTSCQGGPKTFTGVELLTEEPSNGIAIAVIVLIPVLLGFLQHRARSAAARLAMEFGSTQFAGFGAFFCFINAIFAGGFGSSSHRPYAAPWIAMLTQLLVFADACQGAVGRLRDIIAERKRRRQMAANEAPVEPSPEP